MIIYSSCLSTDVIRQCWVMVINLRVLLSKFVIRIPGARFKTFVPQSSPMSSIKIVVTLQLNPVTQKSVKTNRP